MVRSNMKGFTLIELMIVVVIIGILAAIAIPNFVQMQARAKEASVKSNMHTTQLAAEDYAVRNDGDYADDVADFRSSLPDSAAGFTNPFTGTDEFPTDDAAGSMTAGQVDYTNNGSTGYVISGCGKDDVPLTLTLSNGS